MAASSCIAADMIGRWCSACMWCHDRITALCYCDNAWERKDAAMLHLHVGCGCSTHDSLLLPLSAARVTCRSRLHVPKHPPLFARRCRYNREPQLQYLGPDNEANSRQTVHSVRQSLTRASFELKAQLAPLPVSLYQLIGVVLSGAKGAQCLASGAVHTPAKLQCHSDFALTGHQTVW